MPTALELTREEREQYIEAARRRAHQTPSNQETDEAREQLLVRLKALAAELKTTYGICRVILFGSLAHGAWFSTDSDIDIAVESTGDAYWKAWSAVYAAFPDRKVDFVDLDMASESLKRSIVRYGVDL